MTGHFTEAVGTVQGCVSAFEATWSEFRDQHEVLRHELALLQQKSVLELPEADLLTAIQESATQCVSLRAQLLVDWDGVAAAYDETVLSAQQIGVTRDLIKDLPGSAPWHERAALVASRLADLVGRMDERVHERERLQFEVTLAMKSDDVSRLGSDGASVRRALTTLLERLEGWDLDGIEAAIEDARETVATAVAQRERAVAGWTKANEDADVQEAMGREHVVTPDARPSLKSADATTADYKATTTELLSWASTLAASCQAKLTADAAKALEKAAAERRTEDKGPPTSCDPQTQASQTDSAPAFTADPIVAQLVAEEHPDPLDVIIEVPRSRPVVLVERLRLLFAGPDADTASDFVESLDAGDDRCIFAAWLWVQLSTPAFKANARFRGQLELFAGGLLAKEGGPEAAFVLEWALRVGPAPPFSDVLDRLYLEYAKQGPLGLRRLAHLSRSWEPPNIAPPYQPRAWIQALALVVDAVSEPGNEAATQEARDFVSRLPRDPAILQSLLAAAIDDESFAQPTMERTPDQTAELLAEALSDDLKDRLQLHDRWSNEHLREQEDDVITEVLTCIEDIMGESHATALRQMSLPDYREKKLRKAILRRSDKGDPTNDGKRFQKLVDQVAGYSSRLDAVRRRRMRELVSPVVGANLLGELSELRAGLDLPRSVVADILLDGDALAAFLPMASTPVEGLDSAWFDSAPLLRGIDLDQLTSPAGKRAAAALVLENAILEDVERAQQEVGTAYFRVKRDELGVSLEGIAEPERGFIAEIIANHEARRQSDVQELRSMAVLRCSELEACGLGASDLRAMLERLEVAAPLAQSELDRLFARCVELDYDASRRIQELTDTAAVLRAEIDLVERNDPLVARAVAAGVAYHDAGALARAVELFRRTVDFINQDDPVLRSDLEQLVLAQEHRPQPPVEASPSIEALNERTRAFLEDARRVWLDASVATALFERATLAKEAGRFDEAAVLFEEVKTALVAAPLLDCPPGLDERFTKDVDLAAVDSAKSTQLKRSHYYDRVGDPIEGVDARRMLAVFADRARGHSVLHAVQAEWCRVIAMEAAWRGDFDTARKASIELYALVTRWAADHWASHPTFPVPIPPADPLFAASVLVACYVIARWRNEDQDGYAHPALWLHNLPGQQFKSESAIRQALAVARESALPRLLGAAAFLPQNEEAERELLEALEDLDRIGVLGVPDARTIGDLAGHMRAEEHQNARRHLGRLLTLGLQSLPHRSSPWILQSFDHLFGLGRASDDVLPSERDEWQQLRMYLERYGGATGKSLKAAWEKVLSYTARIEETCSKALAPTIKGIREVLARLRLPIELPDLTISLEEDFAVVDGGSVELTLAFRNGGSEPIRDIQIHSLERSQLVLARPELPWHLDERLDPGQVIVRRLTEVVLDGDLEHSATLGLRVTCRGIGEDEQELPHYTTVVRLRDVKGLPILDHRQLRQLFYESGVEVSDQGKNFFGREDELEFLDNVLLMKRPPDAVLLEGMRRVGKTSLAKVFSANARSLSHRAAFVDFKQYANSGGSDDSPVAPWRTLAFLATRILEIRDDDGSPVGACLGFGGFGWKEMVYRRFMEAFQPADMLRDLLVDVSARLPDDGLLLVVLDELDYLVDPWEGGTASHQNVYDFFNVLRGLIADQVGPLGRYRWLLSGSDRCKDMLSDYSNPLYGSITRKRIHGVDADDCSDMLRRPLAKANVEISDPALAEVFDLSGGLPFFVNIIGNRLCKVLMEHPSDFVSRWHVREAVARSMPGNAKNEAEAPYDRLLEPIADRARRHGQRDEAQLNYVLALIAARTSEAEPHIALGDLMGFSEKLLGARMSQKQLMDVVHVLASFDWVDEQQKGDQLVFEIKLPLLRRFVRDKYDYQIEVVRQRLLAALDGAASA